MRALFLVFMSCGTPAWLAACAGGDAPEPVGEGEGEGEGLDPPTGPDQIECRCRDDSVVVACVEACTNEQAKCEVLCRDNGGAFGNSCFPRQAACLIGDDVGGNGLVCPCPGERDTGVCTSLDCGDTAAIGAVCAATCPDASVGPICTNDDASCGALGAPTGRESVRCGCVDAPAATVCVASVCGGRVDADSVCDAACGGESFGIESCEFLDLSCALGEDLGGPRAIECHCNRISGLGACTSLDCDDDAARIGSECAAACEERGAQGPFEEPSCRDDDRCEGGGPPRGPSLSFCRCIDDTFVSQCGVGCGIDDCRILCAEHGGEDFPQGCSQQEVSCIAGGEGGPNAIACDCDFSDDVAACTQIDCTDASAVEAVCRQACINDDFVSASCVVDDVGCAANGIPDGENNAICTCGDGTEFPFCVEDCGDERVTGSCFTLCSDLGGFQEFSCESDALCGG